MTRNKLTFNTRKSLCNHLGEKAGNELADFLNQLAVRLEAVECNKIDITRVVPETRGEASSNHLPTSC